MPTEDPNKKEDDNITVLKNGNITKVYKIFVFKISVGIGLYSVRH